MIDIKVLVVYLFFEVYMKWKVESVSDSSKGSYYYGYWQDHLPHDISFFFFFLAICCGGSEIFLERVGEDLEYYDIVGYRYWFILLTAVMEFIAYAEGIAIAVHLSIGSRYTWGYVLFSLPFRIGGKLRLFG
jgi:hypothetical protein